LAHKNAGHDHHDDCLDCTDLPLDQNSLSRRFLTQETQIRSLDVDCFPEFVAPICDETLFVAEAVSRARPIASATKLSISTTVILC
jgi:hypothetical protein